MILGPVHQGKAEQYYKYSNHVPPFPPKLCVSTINIHVQNFHIAGVRYSWICHSLQLCSQSPDAVYQLLKD